ncbi:pyridoxal phosphate-dependent aminotransferase [bacterium]|nr:pyridoxal phosphate-dependent aminotransferase [bacterium]
MISHRASQTEDSITMAISAMAQQMRKEGKPVLGFSAGEPDFKTPVFIQDAGIAAIREGKTTYTAASGIPELKQAICAKLLRDNDLEYKPNNIVVSCGAKQSIYNALMALVDPGDEVIVPIPYWVSYPDQINLVGGRSVFVQTDESNDFKMTASQLVNAITPKTKLLILNSPSNPTGSVYTRRELEEIARIIVEHNILVISDEIYEKLIYDSEEGHISIASLSPEVKSRTIVINGVSKAYSMTGWRIGYAAAPTAIADAMGKIQSHCTSNPTTPSQWASVTAINGEETEITAMKNEFHIRRNAMVQGLNDIVGISCVMPKGAFYAFPNISQLIGKRSPSGEITNSASLCKLLLQDALVACVPGSGFGADKYIRLSYATSMENIVEGMKRIKEWVASLR